ncbi:MAG: hypothetical protein JNM66_10425 [Bryobacterales bacterium]|nr:hypothetical protein [Bryobacterales bacterium]
MHRLLFVLLSLTVSALDIGEKLPPMKGEFLTGRDATLPGAANGRPALIAVGFTYKSRFAVEEWVKRFRADFDREPGVTFYEVPMIGGMGVMGKWFINSGMKRGTPKANHENVITVYGGGAGEWKKRLGYREEDAAYLLLIDKTGAVAWKYTGLYDAAQYPALAAKVKALLP